jgi:hypothetical protein
MWHKHSDSWLTCTQENSSRIASACYLSFCLEFPPMTDSRSRSKSKLYYDRRPVGQSVWLSGTHVVHVTNFLKLFLDSYGFVDVGRPLWQEVGSVALNCCWVSPTQSFSGLSPTGLMTTLYCLNFWDSPNLEGKVTLFIFLRNRVALLWGWS